jgi:hypothetical protein
MNFVHDLVLQCIHPRHELIDTGLSSRHTIHQSLKLGAQLLKAWLQILDVLIQGSTSRLQH